jgi:uroporphyrinogen-III synthase
MRVIVTRVQPQAARWVKLLSPSFDAIALPLIDTHALADTRALQASGQAWGSYAAVMFVSSHAVDFFFAANPALLQACQGAGSPVTRAWATGPGTRAALLAQGLPAQRIDSPPSQAGQFDSEALWQQVHGQVKPGERVLIVRGDSGGLDDAAAPASGPAQGVGRDWLAQTLREAGAEVDFVVAYRRSAPLWGVTERSLAAQAAVDGSVWLFSSAEAVGHLGALLPGQSWAGARAVATHGRIAQAARALGFAVVHESTPSLAQVKASIESLA